MYNCIYNQLYPINGHNCDKQLRLCYSHIHYSENNIWSKEFTSHLQAKYENPMCAMGNNPFGWMVSPPKPIAFYSFNYLLVATSHNNSM